MPCLTPFYWNDTLLWIFTSQEPLLFPGCSFLMASRSCLWMKGLFIFQGIYHLVFTLGSWSLLHPFYFMYFLWLFPFISVYLFGVRSLIRALDPWVLAPDYQGDPKPWLHLLYAWQCPFSHFHYPNTLIWRGSPLHFTLGFLDLPMKQLLFLTYLGILMAAQIQKAENR